MIRHHVHSISVATHVRKKDKDEKEIGGYISATRLTMLIFMEEERKLTKIDSL